MDIKSKMTSVVENFTKINKEASIGLNNQSFDTDINNNKVNNQILEKTENKTNLNIEFIKTDINNIWMGIKIIEEIDYIKNSNNEMIGLIENNNIEFSQVMESLEQNLVELKNYRSNDNLIISRTEKLFFEDSLNKEKLKVDIPQINKIHEVEEIIREGKEAMLSDTVDVVKTVFEEINTKDVQSNFNWQSLNEEVKTPHLSKNNEEGIKENKNKVNISGQVKENLVVSTNSKNDNYNKEILTEQRSVVLNYSEIDTKNNLRNTLINNNNEIEASIKKINNFVSKIIENSDNQIRNIENRKEFDISEFIGKEKNLKMIYNDIDNNLLNKLLRN